MNAYLVARKLAVSAVAVFLFAAAFSTASARIRPPMAMFASVARGVEFDPLAVDSLRPSERTFVRQAQELSRASARIAQLGVSNAAGADVRAFAQQLVTDHRQIAVSLDELARKKGVVMLPLSNELATNYERLTTLTAPQFDKEFVRTVSDLEDATMKIYEKVLSDAKDTDVKDLAGSFLPTLRDHQNKLSDLKKSLE